MKKIFFATLVILHFGCAVSRKVNYEGINANMPALNQKISIATWDQREQVISGKRKTDFVGYMRSAAGIAYPMGTKSGNPFSDIVSADISSSLAAKGNITIVINTTTNEQESAILHRLKQSGNNKLILITCKQFHTDGYGETTLEYNLIVTVYTVDGTTIKQKTFSGKKPLGGTKGWGPGNFKAYMPEALKILIEEMFNDQEIISALKSV